jgi:hypothetical protein
MNRRTTKYAVALALAAGAGVIGACSDTAPTQPPRSTGLHFNVTPGIPGKKLVLCKEGASGTFTADLGQSSVHSGSLVVTSPFTLNAGQCIDVYVGRTNPVLEEPIDEVTITETSGTPVSIRLVGVDGTQCLVAASGPNFMTLWLNTFNGCILTFVNEPPPPPPGGGCTPGFWKNSVGSWPAAYLPSADFDATFGVNGFNPNISLLTAAGLGGGGKNALARHAVAALLNSASADVDYGMTTAGVIALVQSAFASGDYESAKNRLEGLNELDCALPNDNSF